MRSIPLKAFETPPENKPYVLVRISPNPARITTLAQVNGPDGTLVILGPYAFAIGNVTECLEAAMEAAKILSDKHSIPIYFRDERASQALPN